MSRSTRRPWFLRPQFLLQSIYDILAARTRNRRPSTGALTPEVGRHSANRLTILALEERAHASETLGSLLGFQALGMAAAARAENSDPDGRSAIARSVVPSDGQTNEAQARMSAAIGPQIIWPAAESSDSDRATGSGAEIGRSTKPASLYWAFGADGDDDGFGLGNRSADVGNDGGSHSSGGVNAPEAARGGGGSSAGATGGGASGAATTNAPPVSRAESSPQATAGGSGTVQAAGLGAGVASPSASMAQVGRITTGRNDGSSLPVSPPFDLAAFMTSKPGWASGTGSTTGQQTAASATFPLMFEANVGQVDSPAQFLVRGAGYTAYLDATGATYVLQSQTDIGPAQSNEAASAAALAQTSSIASVRVELVGANGTALAETGNRLATKSNYYVGKDPTAWHTDVPEFGGVIYRGEYSGIDLNYYGNADHQLEYDFVVAAGADPGVIQFVVSGADNLRLDDTGNLIIRTVAGDLTKQAPTAYQETAAGRQSVISHYTLLGDNRIGLEVGAYDETRPLVIDPIVTPLGAPATGTTKGIATDAQGGIYVTGIDSSGVYVAKLDSSGSEFTYLSHVGNSYLAGTPVGIAVDAAGSAYVAGTASTAFGIQTTSGVIGETAPSGADAAGFVTKFDPTGTLSYSTYVGGPNGSTTVTGMAVDASGDAYVTGAPSVSLDSSTSEYTGTFPTSNGFQDTYSGENSTTFNKDAYIAELNSTATSYVYSTYLGGLGDDTTTGIAVDASGAAYVTGYTLGYLSGSTYTDNFPVQASGSASIYQSTFGGDGLTTNSYDGFITKVSAGGSLDYSTYLGGQKDDRGSAIAVDLSGTVFVSGTTTSVTTGTPGVGDYPVSANAYQTTALPSTSGAPFVTHLTADGATILYSTLLGAANIGDSYRMAIDSSDNVYIVGGLGITAKNEYQFNSSQYDPILILGLEAHQQAIPPVLTKLSQSGSDVIYATAVDPAAHGPVGMATDLGGNVYLAGVNSTLVTVVGGMLPPSFMPQVHSGDLVASEPGLAAEPSSLADTGVRYADGSAFVTANDLPDIGFDLPWGQTRTWSSAAGYDYAGGNGIGWVDSQLPQLIPAYGTTTLALISDGMTARYFDQLETGLYYTRIESLDFETLHGTERVQDEFIAYDEANDQYVLTDTSGAQIRFEGFADWRSAAQRGRFFSYAGPDGVVTSVTDESSDGHVHTIQRSVTVGTTTVVDSFEYSYTAGLLQSVTWRRATNGGSADVIRWVGYSYYGSGEPCGNVGDLKAATQYDSFDQDLETSYYRYYTPADATNALGDTEGFVHGLKFVITGPAFARLTAEVGDPSALSDEIIAPYADHQFQYDEERRVTSVVVAGAGGTTGSGAGNMAGHGTFEYAYGPVSDRPNSSTVHLQFGYGDFFSAWKYQTTETRPDGAVRTVFANGYGEVMLDSLYDSTTNQTNTWYYYYGDGLYGGVAPYGFVSMRIHPSAVIGYDPTDRQLMDFSYDSYYGTYLPQEARASHGLVDVYYYSVGNYASDPDEVGGPLQVINSYSAIGYLGIFGIGASTEYTNFHHSLQSVDDRTTYRVSQILNLAGETDYSFTWSATSLEPLSMVETDPTISSAEDGPGSSDPPDTTTTYFDAFGRPIWTKDADGFLSYTAYDPASGAIIETIDDVDIAALTFAEAATLPSDPSWVTPAGGGSHRKTTYSVDPLGRVTKEVDPDGVVTFTTYDDVNHEVRTYAGWDPTLHGGDGGPTEFTQVVRYDWVNGYTESLTTSGAPDVDIAGNPTGHETIPDVESLSRSYTNLAGQVTYHDEYFAVAGLTYAPGTLGTLGVNYNRTLTDYDAAGRASRNVASDGTITRTVFDGFGRQTSSWVGTSDTVTGTWSPTNPGGMVEISANVYDAAGSGNGNVTQTTDFANGATNPRVTQNAYDWDDRLVATKSGVQASETDGLHRPIMYYHYDSLDRVIETDRYDGDGVSIYVDVDGDGTPDAPSSSLLRAKTTTDFDEQGRVARTHVFSVDPISGNPSLTTLDTSTWYDHLGQVIKTVAPGGVVTKTKYDGDGRVIVNYTTDGGGDTDWSDADDVTGDVVLEQTNYYYGETIAQPDTTVVRQRDHDATGTGDLAISGGPASRAYYSATYYDDDGRDIADVNVGTNGGTAWTAPTTIPTRSDTVLVTSTEYDDEVNQTIVTDPRGVKTLTQFDADGRTTDTIAAWDNTGVRTNSANKTTHYTYDAAGHVATESLLLPGTDQQTTQYVYGVTLPGGATANDLLATIKHPDPATGLPSTSASYQETYTYDDLGEVATYTDQNGTLHTYSYDVLGRQIADAVTLPTGSAVSNSILRLETAYDSQGNAYKFTSYNAASGGSVVNQVVRLYNGLNQLVSESQDTTTVSVSSPTVYYTYAEMADGANNSRPTGILYSGGYDVYYNYGAIGSLNDRISRLDSLTDDWQTLEAYSYLGLGTVVSRIHPYSGNTGPTQTFIVTGGDSGDAYGGLDRFGRVREQKWTQSSTTIEDLRYTYDRNSDPLYRQDLVNGARSELYQVNGNTSPQSGYDPLGQLTAFARGTLTDTNSDGYFDTVASPSQSQSWATDAAGNFTSVTTNGIAVNRTANAQNEVTSVGGTTLGYNAAGDTTTDDQGHTLIYDAWHRLVQVKTGSTVNATYTYDALGRRMSETHGATTNLFFNSASGQVLEIVNSTTDQWNVWSPVYQDALVARISPAPKGHGHFSQIDGDDGESESVLGGDGGVTTNATNPFGTLVILWAVEDANWDTTAIVKSGAVVERYAYDPYGSVTYLNASWVTQSSSANGMDVLFQGKRYDTATKTYDFAARAYSPSLGRFLSQDPKQYDAGDANFYRFVGNGPVGMTDPSGMDSHDYYGSGGSQTFWDVMFDLKGWWTFLTGPGAETGAKAIAMDTVVALPPLRIGAAAGFILDLGDQGLGNATDLRRGDSLRGLNWDEAQNMTIAGGLLGPFAKYRSVRAGLGLMGFGTGAAEIRRGDYEQGTYKVLLGGLATYSARGPKSEPAVPVKKYSLSQGGEFIEDMPFSRAAPRALPANSITTSEAAEIQSIANRYNTTIDIVGSRAAGQGRNVGTNLPVGKGPGTRSDIDFRIDAAHAQVDALIANLQRVGNGAGTAGAKWSTNPAIPGGRATVPPVIRFTPE
jgi:RHS repeat-associated protein